MLSNTALMNSWHSFAPNGSWLVFSSKRRAASNGGPGVLLPQLYIAAVVTTVNGTTETVAKDYPAIYVTSQIANQNNHTPAWDNFQIPLQ